MVVATVAPQRVVLEDAEMGLPLASVRPIRVVLVDVDGNPVDPSKPWELAGAWEHSEDVAVVDFPDLGGYQELLVIGQDITAASAANRVFAVSADGGDTWVSGAGEYGIVSNVGEVSEIYYGRGHYTGSAEARSFAFRITPWAVGGAPHLWDGNMGAGIITSTEAFDAMRFLSLADDFSTPVDLTAGSIMIWGR